MKEIKWQEQISRLVEGLEELKDKKREKESGRFRGTSEEEDKEKKRQNKEFLGILVREGCL